MKKFFNNIFSLSLTLGLGLSLGLTSCEDVPAPYEVNLGESSSTSTSTELVGDGTQAKPYTSSDLKTLLDGGKLASTVYAFAQGRVSQFDSLSTQYGNAYYNISANGSTSGTQIIVYRGYYTGGNKFTSQDQALSVGDSVVIYGTFQLYSGKYEINQGSKIAYLNGKTYDVGVVNESDLGDPKGTGTAADPFNISAAIAKCKETGETATADKFYVKGIAKSVDASGIASHGNITVDMVDKPSSSAVFKAFQIYSFNSTKFSSSDADVVKAGDTIVVLGNLVNYKGNTPETSGKGTACLVSVNGTVPEPTKPSLEAGSGTYASPYNTPRALALIASGKMTTDTVYVVGRVKSSLKLIDHAEGAGSYGICFAKIDSTELYVKGLGLGGVDFVDEEDIMPNDSVIVYGILTANGLVDSRIVYLNGETAGIYTPPTPDTTHVEGNLLTNSSFEEWADDKTPTDWKSASSASNATLSKSERAHTGKYSVQANGTTSGNKRLAYKEITLTAGTYVMSFYVQAEDANCSVRPGYATFNADGTINSQGYKYGDYANDVTKSEWREVTYEFTLDADQQICPVVMISKNPGANALIDDFTLLKK